MIKQIKNVQQVTAAIWDIFVRLYPELKTESPPVVKFDKRYKNFWAKAGGGVIIYSFQDVIKHNAFYCAEIVGHEVCHLVQDCLHGLNTDDHGAEWAALMSQIGLDPVAEPSPY